MNGFLFLIVGPSGSGKDTMIDYITKNFDIKKVKRVITREKNLFEDFTSVTLDEFKKMKFFVTWESYNKFYGIPELNPKENYVLNVSREVINKIKTLWPKTKVIELRCSPEQLKERLFARKRDIDYEITKRLERKAEVVSDYCVDTTDHDPSIAGKKIIEYIKKIIK